MKDLAKGDFVHCFECNGTLFHVMGGGPKGAPVLLCTCGAELAIMTKVIING